MAASAELTAQDEEETETEEEEEEENPVLRRRRLNMARIKEEEVKLNLAGAAAEFTKAVQAQRQPRSAAPKRKAEAATRRWAPPTGAVLLF